MLLPYISALYAILFTQFGKGAKAKNMFSMTSSSLIYQERFTSHENMLKH